MRFLYNIVFTIFFLLSAPFYFVKMWRRGNWMAGFGERFGRYSSKVKQALTNRHVIWLHAVSVGEVNICTQLIQALEPRLPNIKIVVSTTTSTGMGELNRKLPSHIQKIYYPIDRRAYAARALASLHPEAIVLIEAEIWPNLLWRAQDMGIPLFLVNARLSARSFRGYRMFGLLFRPVFAAFAGVGCQDTADAERLQRLGVKPSALHVVGNLKFDAAKLDERRVLDVPQLLRQLGVPPGSPVIVAGSTHAGEEAILADIFTRLRMQFPGLFLVLVPRHFERGKEVGRELANRGLKFVYRSEISIHRQYNESEAECLVVNTTGELKYFYEHANLIFVGKSLSAEGGQNPVEPGALAKPMIFGPNMQNFEAIARALVSRGGAVQVKDAQELEEAMRDILSDPKKADELGQSALGVVRENMGAIERTVDMIVSELDAEDMYVPNRQSRSPQKQPRMA